LWIVLGALLVGAVILVIIGLRYQDEEDPLQKRLAEFAESGKPVSLEEVELSQPFAERIIFPAARKLGELVTKFTPQNTLQATAIKLERAGNPAGLDPNVFFTFRLVGLSLGPLIYWLASISPESSPYTDEE
jgi:tight adherence protein C